MRSSHVKPSRNRVNLSGSEVSRGWRKHLGKSKDEIEAAIGKDRQQCRKRNERVRSERAQRSPTRTRVSVFAARSSGFQLDEKYGAASFSKSVGPQNLQLKWIFARGLLGSRVRPHVLLLR